MTTPSPGDGGCLPVSGDEAVPDAPRRGSRTLPQSCAGRGVRIRYVLETHVHDEHVQGQPIG